VRAVGSRSPIALDYIDALHKICVAYRVPVDEVLKALDYAASFTRKERTIDWIPAQRQKVQEAYGIVTPIQQPQNPMPSPPHIINPFAEQPKVEPTFVQLRTEMMQRAYHHSAIPLSDLNSLLPSSPALAPCVFPFVIRDQALMVLLLMTREINREGKRYSLSHSLYHPSIVGAGGKKDESVKNNDPRQLRDNLGMSISVSLDSSNAPNYYGQSENLILRAYLCQDGCMVRYWLSDRGLPTGHQNMEGMDTFWLVHNSQLIPIDRPTHTSRLV